MGREEVEGKGGGMGGLRGGGRKETRVERGGKMESGYGREQGAGGGMEVRLSGSEGEGILRKGVGERTK